jgi:hypothetical protein
MFQAETLHGLSLIITNGIYNRALSAAEVLSLCVNGPALADIGASQVSLTTGVWLNNFTTVFDTFSSASGAAFTGSTSTTKTGIRVRVPASIPSPGRYLVSFTPTFSNATLTNIFPANTFSGNVFTPSGSNPTVVSGQLFTAIYESNLANSDSLVFSINTGAGANSFEVSGFSITRLGITGQWNAQDAQSNTGQIFDSSGNKNHALLPAAGATIIGKETAQVRQVRWTNTWDGTNELQYIGGVNQAILPANAYIESIMGTVSGATPHDIIIGDGSDTDRYVTITTGLAAGTTSFTLANRTTDGTNLKLTVDPDTNATMSIAWVITYTTLE